MDEPLARTVSAQIRIRIREKILSGAYPPGSQLLQDSIAAEFGTSKIPVREALLQLRSEGLVDIFAHRGFQVRPLSKAEVAEVARPRLRTARLPRRRCTRSMRRWPLASSATQGISTVASIWRWSCRASTP
jgi:DNA-binding GntR family transcriptional regulator